ncbi:MAG: hypothetical protein ACOYXC_12435 [Candidatus Rifleibacteriota bacterium]
MKKILLSALVGSLLFAGCGSEPEAKPATPAPAAAPAKEMSKTDQLHQKAKVAEAASIVGYDGKDIRQKLDKIIDENAAHEKMLKDVNDL